MDEALEMPAGKEMDARIALEVMKLPVLALEDAPCPYCGDEMRFCGERSWCSTCREWRYSGYKEYSDDIAAAMEVVEKLHPDYSIALSYDDPATIEEIKWCCELYAKDEPYTDYEARADTAPLAICRVALLATRVKVELEKP
jgi:hypothetical protein